MELAQRTTKEMIGRMRERITYKMYLSGRDTDGGELKTWVTSNAVWAGVQYATRGDETEQIGRKAALQYVTFLVYFRQAINTKWRIVYRNAEFEIMNIMPDETRQFMQIEAVQQSPWLDDYLASPVDGFWTDASGNFWVTEVKGPDMETQPTFGSLTWTDADGNSWTVS